MGTSLKEFLGYLIYLHSNSFPDFFIQTKTICQDHIDIAFPQNTTRHPHRPSPIDSLRTKKQRLSHTKAHSYRGKRRVYFAGHHTFTSPSPPATLNSQREATRLKSFFLCHRTNYPSAHRDKEHKGELQQMRNKQGPRIRTGTGYACWRTYDAKEAQDELTTPGIEPRISSSESPRSVAIRSGVQLMLQDSSGT